MTPRTQKITSNLTGGWSSGGNRVRIDVCRIRLYVYDGCHAPARTRKRSASIAREIYCCVSITLRCGRPVGPGLLHFAASGLPLSRTSSASETADPAQRSQTGIHRQTSAQPGPASPHVCCGQRIVHQRGGQLSVARATAARARAWVSRNQFGNVLCNWNIDSTVYWQTSLRTCMNCSCPTDASQSEAILRKEQSPRQE